MATNDADAFTLDSLQSQEQVTLLDEIDQLRLQGIGDFVPLPQLVVCGDQSSGKSSVLEAISGIPFPRKDTLCTRFATEVILRKAAKTTVRVSIIPNPTRSSEECNKLHDFQASITQLQDVPDLIEKAKDEMRLLGGDAFFDDVLQIEVSGPKRPHLTLVDLPGLIHSENKNQNRKDVELVSGLIERYIKNRRSIILAVVSAKNDIANQVVLDRARHVDRHGNRTLGIITKPDVLDPGSDSEVDFASLARNEDVHFRLGWHVVRNRDYDSRHASDEERDSVEADFLSKGIWHPFPPAAKGIAALRTRLSKVLLSQIRSELPGLIKDIQVGLDQCRSTLHRLGDDRKTSDQQQKFLLKLSYSFNALCKEATDGVYEQELFEDPLSPTGYPKRLRAVVQNLNLEFSDVLRSKGHSKTIVDQLVEPVAATPDPDAPDSPSSASTDLPAPNLPEVMSRPEAIKWIGKLLKNSRGRELPGSFNPLLIGQVFYEQSSRWEGLARQHVRRVWKASKHLVEAVSSTLMDEDTCGALLFHYLDPIMEERLSKANEKLDGLLVDRRRHPITYNHYYTETLQKVKKERLRNSLDRGIERWHQSEAERTSKASFNLTRISAYLKTETEVDMDTYACSEVLDCVDAYYKVAMKTFVDNVAIQVVEGALIGDLSDVFSPIQVSRMSSEQITEIAAESEQNRVTREQVGRKLAILEKGMTFCERHIDRQSIARNVIEEPSGTETPTIEAGNQVKHATPTDQGPDETTSSQPVSLPAAA